MILLSRNFPFKKRKYTDMINETHDYFKKITTERDTEIHVL